MSNAKRFTLEEAVALTYDDSDILLYPLTQREAFMLLGQIDFIGWQTRWKERSFTQDYLDKKVASIADGLMNPQGASMSCEDVEDCLETSTIINTIEGDVTSIQGSVSAVESDITTINEQITIINQSAQYNIYPPAPDPISDPDPYCGTAWYIAEYLNAYIQDVIVDALTLTWQEVAIGLLGIGGFDASLAKLLWDYIIASANPDLDDECTVAIETVAEAFFCNDLLISPTLTQINASALTTGAKQAYTKAIESLTASKFSELIYLGSLDETRDCSAFCPTCGTVEATVTTGTPAIPPPSPLTAGTAVTVATPTALMGLSYVLTPSNVAEGWLQYNGSNCYNGVEINYRVSGGGVGNITALRFDIDGNIVDVNLPAYVPGTIYANQAIRLPITILGSSMKINGLPTTSTKQIAINNVKILTKNP